MIHPHCQMRIWLKTTLATSCPLVTNSLGKAVKVPTRCTLAVKHLNTLAACLTLHIHTHPVNVCSTNTSASNDVPVPLVSHLKEESGRVSGGGAVSWVEWRSYPYISWSIKEWGTRPLLQWRFRQDMYQQQRPGHLWLGCYSICLHPRTEKLLMAPRVTSQHEPAAHQRGLQQVCTTCQPCPGPVNMKHSYVCFKVEGTDTM